MPIVKVNGVDLHYVEQGQGDETIVFSHGYLMSHKMYQHQIDALSEHYRVIAFEHRCHGESQTVTTPFGIYDLVDDAAAFIKALDLGAVHFAGMSTGGYVGLRLMLNHPQLVKSMVLIDTAASAEAVDKKSSYDLLMTIIRYLGPRLILNKVTSILMGRKFLSDKERRFELDFWKNYILSLNKKGLYQFGHAIFSRDSVLEKLALVDVPTLVVVGREDLPTPLSEAQAMVDGIEGAELAIIEDAGHTSPIEEPQQVTQALQGFYKKLST